MARTVRDGLHSLAAANNIPNNKRQLLASIGYSMGAIILSNYVARSVVHYALDDASDKRRIGFATANQCQEEYVYFSQVETYLFI